MLPRASIARRRRRLVGAARLHRRRLEAAARALGRRGARGARGAILDHHGNTLRLRDGLSEAAFTAHNASEALRQPQRVDVGAPIGAAVHTVSLPGAGRRARHDRAVRAHAAAGLPTTFEYLAGWAYFHALAHTELSSDRSPRACTGVVAQLTTTTGAVVHGANMDQTPPEVRTAPTWTLRVSFVNGSAHLFEGVDWYWFTTGVSRAVRRGLASVQENWRFGSVRAADVLADVDAGVVPQTGLSPRLRAPRRRAGRHV